MLHVSIHTSSKAPLGTKADGNAVVLPGRSNTHSPDPDTIGRNKPVAIVFSKNHSERILGEFLKQYVGPAYGIDKAELEVAKDGEQRIVVFVSDWNGVVNISESYQGMKLAFVQFVPPSGVWQL